MPSMDALITEMLAFKQDKTCQSANEAWYAVAWNSTFPLIYQHHPIISNSIYCTTLGIQSVESLPNVDARSRKPDLVVRIKLRTSQMAPSMQAYRTELYIDRPDVHAKAH